MSAVGGGVKNCIVASRSPKMHFQNTCKKTTMKIINVFFFLVYQFYAKLYLELSRTQSAPHAHTRGPFRTQSNIYDEAFFAKMVNH